MEQTATDQIDADPELIFDKLDAWLDGFFRLLPNIAVAIVVFILFVGLGLLVAWLIRRGAAARDRRNLGQVSGSLIKWGIYIMGALLAATIVVPSLKPGDLIAGLGIGSVAIGFAFKDILQNMLAGILILIRQPFSVGDQIVVGDYEGTVEQIETRATLIKTYDGRRVVIPNSDVYTDAVTVNTAFEKRRSQYDLGIGYADDWPAAMALATKTVAGVEGVLSDPAPETIAVDLGDSAKVMRVRWWTDSVRTDVVHTMSRVLLALEAAMNEAGIDMPYPTEVHLFHDQTEETDGRRDGQREGWPAAGGEVPRSRFDAQADSAKADAREAAE